MMKKRDKDKKMNAKKTLEGIEGNIGCQEVADETQHSDKILNN